MTTTLQIYPGVASISDRFTGVLLDAYGVFWGGNDFGLLPGAKETMEALVSNGKIVGILSNSTQLAEKEMSKLERHGLHQGKHFHFYITSGDAARAIFLSKKLPFETPKNKYWLFCGGHPKFSPHKAIFEGTQYSETLDLDEADFVYVSVPHIGGEDQTDPERFREMVEAVRLKNLRMVCANPDRFAHEGMPPKMVVRQGSIAAMYEEIGGHVFYIGKPYEEVYQLALENFKKYNRRNLKEILMVGDTPETDIRGAKRVGIPAALITETGVLAERISHKGMETTVAALTPSDSPDYFIKRFSDDIRAAL